MGGFDEEAYQISRLSQLDEYTESVVSRVDGASL